MLSSIYNILLKLGVVLLTISLLNYRNEYSVKFVIPGISLLSFAILTHLSSHFNNNNVKSTPYNLFKNYTDNSGLMAGIKSTIKKYMNYLIGLSIFIFKYLHYFLIIASCFFLLYVLFFKTITFTKSYNMITNKTLFISSIIVLIINSLMLHINYNKNNKSDMFSLNQKKLINVNELSIVNKIIGIILGIMNIYLIASMSKQTVMFQTDG